MKEACVPIKTSSSHTHVSLSHWVSALGTYNRSSECRKLLWDYGLNTYSYVRIV